MGIKGPLRGTQRRGLPAPQKKAPRPKPHSRTWRKGKVSSCLAEAAALFVAFVLRLSGAPGIFGSKWEEVFVRSLK